MSTPLRVVAIVSTFAALGLGTVAWRQHRELLSLRDAATVADEQGAHKWTGRAHSAAVEEKGRFPVAETAVIPPSPGQTPDTPAPSTKKPAPGTKKGPSRQEILAFLNTPDAQRTLAAKFREQVDARYGPLLAALALDPAQQTRLRELLIERQGAVIDVAAALLASGAKPKDADLNILVAGAQGETDQKLQAALGPANYARFRNYDNAQLFRGAANDLQKSLAKFDLPLTPAQTEKFTTGMNALAQSSLTPDQQQAMRALARMEQSKQTLKQVEQVFNEAKSNAGTGKPAKKSGP